jgi:hypothetical protein
MGTVTAIRGKTEQRVAQVMSILQDAPEPMSYDQLRLATGATPSKKAGVMYGGVAYDQLLYILSTLIAVGLVERLEEPERKQGRPRIYFKWQTQTKAARAGGTRLSA